MRVQGLRTLQTAKRCGPSGCCSPCPRAWLPAAACPQPTKKHRRRTHPTVYLQSIQNCPASCGGLALSGAAVPYSRPGPGAAARFCGRERLCAEQQGTEEVKAHLPLVPPAPGCSFPCRPLPAQGTLRRGSIPGCAEALTQLLHQALSLLVLGDVGEQLPAGGGMQTCRGSGQLLPTTTGPTLR